MVKIDNETLEPRDYSIGYGGTLGGVPLDGEGHLAFTKEDLATTRSTFLSDDIIVERKGRATYNIVPLLILAFVIVIFIAVGWLIEGSGENYNTISTNLPRFISYMAVISVLFGILFIIVGWLDFSSLKASKSIQSTTVEKANGLNEIQGTLISERDSLKSPISNQKCVFYQIELQERRQIRDSAYWATIARYGKGVPALLADNTGYLAIDIPNAYLGTKNIGFRYNVVDDQNKPIYTKDKESQELLNYINSSPDNFDISNIEVNLAFSSKFKLAVFDGNQVSILETIIPLSNTEFATGRVISTNKDLNGKEVKAMIFDNNTKLLSLLSESKATLEKTDITLAYVSFGSGIILLAAVLFYIVSAH